MWGMVGEKGQGPGRAVLHAFSVTIVLLLLPGKTDVSTVVDGQLCQSSVRRLPYGGQDLTEHMARLMEQRGVQLKGGSAEALKEMCMQVGRVTPYGVLLRTLSQQGI